MGKLLLKLGSERCLLHLVDFGSELNPPNGTLAIIPVFAPRLLDSPTLVMAAVA